MKLKKIEKNLWFEIIKNLTTPEIKLLGYITTEIKIYTKKNQPLAWSVGIVEYANCISAKE